MIGVSNLGSVHREVKGDESLLFAKWVAVTRRSLHEENMFDVRHHVSLISGMR